MSAPTSSTSDAAATLTAHLRDALALQAAGVAAVRRARLLKIADLLAGPFPQVTTVVVTVANDDGRIDLVAVRDAEGCRWARDDDYSTYPDGHSAADRTSVSAVLEAVAYQLEDLLGDDDPREVWKALDVPDTYRVRLPDAAELDRARTVPPQPVDCGYADITSLLDALTSLRAWLDSLRRAADAIRVSPRAVKFSRAARARHAAAMDALYTELGLMLAFIAATAVAKHDQHRLRCDRDPH